MRRVAFDTTAWFEVLAESAVGGRLSREYLEDPGTRVFTPSLVLAELSAKLARTGLQDQILTALLAVEGGSEIAHLSTPAAMRAGPLLLELRQADPGASLADAVMLATARDHDATLVSNDRAFRGQEDVVAF